MIDDGNDLERRSVLRLNRPQRCAKAIPAPFGVGADDDGDGGLFDHHSAGMDRE